MDSGGDAPVLKEDPERKVITPTAYIVHGSLSRFSPLSFRARFSALVVGRSLSTVFGWAARAIFVLGLALAVTSSTLGVWERREELAVFAVGGFESSVTVLFLVESVLTVGACFILASAMAVAALYALSAGPLPPAALGYAFGVGFVYLPIMIVTATLLPSHAVASKSPLELMRRGV
jgi:hypothetical protein